MGIKRSSNPDLSLVRDANMDDVPAIIAIKASMPMPGIEEKQTHRGGFILGTIAATYMNWIREGAHCKVLCFNGVVRGFAIGLPDKIFRASEIWLKRTSIYGWSNTLAQLEVQKLGYFEQMAVTPDCRPTHYTTWLAAQVMCDFISTGHEHIFTTTVREPVLNAAALPYLRRCGAKRLGSIEENYPEVGRILSDVYHMDAANVKNLLTKQKIERPWLSALLSL